MAKIKKKRKPNSPRPAGTGRKALLAENDSLRKENAELRDATEKQKKDFRERDAVVTKGLEDVTASLARGHKRLDEISRPLERGFLSRLWWALKTAWRGTLA